MKQQELEKFLEATKGHVFKPFPYQVELMKAIERGGRHVCLTRPKIHRKGAVFVA